MEGHWVLLDEMADRDELGPVALALFIGFLFTRSEKRLEYVEGLSLDAALVWARERATRVEVRLSGFDANSYSAGSQPTPAPPIERAGEIVWRRPAGWEFLDRTEADDPIAWDVVIDADRVTLDLLATEGSGTVGRSWQRAVDATPGCQVQLMRDSRPRPLWKARPVRGRRTRTSRWPCFGCRLELPKRPWRRPPTPRSRRAGSSAP